MLTFSQANVNFSPVCSDCPTSYGNFPQDTGTSHYGNFHTRKGDFPTTGTFPYGIPFTVSELRCIQTSSCLLNG
ncbi:hypothetical protein CHUAL_006878 [Chamberlinius hualienensis]